MKSIVLYGAWYGSHNVGDQAILLTIADSLTKLMGDVEIIVLTTNPEQVVEYGNRESKSKIRAYHNRWQFPHIVGAIAKSDLFILGGGVPFYQEPDHLFAIGLLVGMARLFRTPYMTWSVSSQIVTNAWAKRMFGWIDRNAAAVTCRDQHTVDLFRSCGVTHPIQITPDPVFGIHLMGGEEAKQILDMTSAWEINRPLVGLTPRTLCGRNRDAETHYNVKTPGDFEREVRCFATALDWLWENGYQPLFIPMNTIPPDDDRIAAKRVINLSTHGEHALLVEQEIRPLAAINMYRMCEFNFVARVHGAINSMIANSPVMIYAFEPKNQGIMESMELHDYTLPETIASPETCIAMMSKLKKNTPELKAFMDQKLVNLQQDAVLPARMAKQIIDGYQTND